MIDHAGALAAGVEALASSAGDAGAWLESASRPAGAVLFGVSSDAREAHWYLARALRDLRELI